VLAPGEFMSGAFGPGTVADIRTWSGVRGLRDVVASMGADLVSFADESGRQMFDLPDAPRPNPEIPAPLRFLPAFDNLMLAYTDRTRLMSDDDRRRVCVEDYIAPTLLLDGMVRGTWTLDHKAGTARLTIQPFHRLTRTDQAAVTDEGARLLTFAAPKDEPHELCILPQADCRPAPHSLGLVQTALQSSR
jgi:Winged helix DNA-binding domain